MYSLALISLYLFEFMNQDLRAMKLSIGSTSKLVSSTHAFITSVVSILYMYQYIPLILYRHLIMISIGYAIYDSYNLYRNSYRDRHVLYLHHFFIIVGIVYCDYYLDNQYYKLLSINYLAEISAIFINFTMFLYETNRTHFKLFHLSSWLLLISFFFTRILTGIWCIVHIYYLESKMIYFQIILTSMNFYWFGKFIQKYLKIYQLNKTKKLS